MPLMPAASATKPCSRDLPPPLPEQHVFAVHSQRRLSDIYLHLEVDAAEGALAVRPGQFFHLLCPSLGADVPFLRRPMSVYEIDRDRGRLGFLYKVVGKGTRTLALLEPGAQLDAVGPLGNGFHIPDGARHLMVLGRGCGLATLHPLVAPARARGAAVTAVISVASRARLPVEPAFADAGAQTFVVSDEEGSSEVSQVETLLGQLAQAKPVDAAYTCGSARLAALLGRMCRAWNAPGQVALEEHMACALGACQGCVRPFRVRERTVHRRVCVDGPVFGLEEVIL